MRGRHSLNLWGPVDGRGANTPVNLSSIQCFGAATRFRCFLGPRAMAALGGCGGGPGGGGGGSGARAVPVRVSRRAPWVVHLQVAERCPGDRWR